MIDSPRLLFCGLISADIHFRVGEMPRRAEKYRAKGLRFSLGGGGAIASVAAHRLGAQVCLAGRLGPDHFGALLHEELHRWSIDPALIVTPADLPTPVSSIFIDDAGERQIVNYRQADEEASVTETGMHQAAPVLDEQRLAEMPAPAAVMVDTRWPAAACQVLAKARDWQVPGVVDGETPVNAEAMRLASHVAFSRQGLRDLSGHDEIVPALRKAARQFGCWVCVTDGEHGVHYLQQDRIHHVPAFAVQAVDTLGAGDAWHAAFTLQLAHGEAEHKAVRYANAAAALKCASPQGLDGMPSHDQVMKLLQESGFGETDKPPVT